MTPFICYLSGLYTQARDRLVCSVGLSLFFFFDHIILPYLTSEICDDVDEDKEDEEDAD